MKQSIILIAALFLSMSISAQSINSFLSQLEDNDDYGVITINKEMFKMLASFDIDLGEDEAVIKDLINGIQKVRVFINEENGSTEDYKKIKDIATGTTMDNLISVKDGAERVDLFTNPTSDDGIVDGLLLLVHEETQNVFIHIDGKINLSHLAKLTEKMDIDGLEHLKKINKKNKDSKKGN